MGVLRQPKGTKHTCCAGLMLWVGSLDDTVEGVTGSQKSPPDVHMLTVVFSDTLWFSSFLYVQWKAFKLPALPGGSWRWELFQIHPEEALAPSLESWYGEEVISVALLAAPLMELITEHKLSLWVCFLTQTEYLLSNYWQGIIFCCCFVHLFYHYQWIASGKTHLWTDIKACS